MLTSQFTQKVLCLVLGFVVVVIAAYVLQYTSAIAAPDAFFEWFELKGYTRAGPFLWDLVVVFGIGLGLPAFIALLALLRFFTISHILCTVYFLVGVLFTAFDVDPMVNNTPLSTTLSRPWRSYGFEASLTLAVITALILARWLGPNSRFNSKADKAGAE